MNANKFDFVIADGSTVTVDFTQQNTLSGVAVNPTTVSRVVARLTDNSTQTLFPGGNNTGDVDADRDPVIEVDKLHKSGKKDVFLKQ